MPSSRDYFIVVSYALLIPGYFLYHFTVSQGYFPSVLGGYWTIACAAMCGPLLFALIRACLAGDVKLAAIDYLFSMFVVIYSLGLLYSYAENKNVLNAAVQIGVLPQFVAFYVLFRLLPTDSILLQRVNLVSFALMSATILSATGSEYHWSYNPGVFIAEEFVATYQGYGLSYLVVSAIAVTLISKPLARQGLFAISLTALFVNGARSELVAMMLLFVIYEIFVSHQKLYLLIFFSVIGALLYIGGGVFLGDGEAGESRVIGLYYDGRNDESANDRLLALELGLQTIADHPIFGSFGDHPPGFYIHNALSAWVDLGLVGFGLYVVLLLAPAAQVFSHSRKFTRNQIAALLSIPILMMFFAIASKHYSYQLLPVSLGLFLNEFMRARFRMARQA